MVSAIIVAILILGLAAQQYVKGSLVKAFVLLVASIIGVLVSLGFYETAAGLLTGFIGAKAFPLAAALLFAFSMVLVMEIAKRLLPAEIYVGQMGDKVGGAVAGAFAGYICAGMLLIIIGLLPYSLPWLYQRYDRVTNPPQPTKAFLNADGFVSGLFSLASSGSLSSTNSFSVLHADFCDQIAINRVKLSDEVAPYAQASVIQAANPSLIKAAENLKTDSKNEDDGEVKQQSGKVLMLARFKFDSAVIDLEEGGSGKLIPAQFRLIVKDKNQASDSGPLSGKGTVVYPAGVVEKGVLKSLPLDKIVEAAELGENVEMAFYVPSGAQPVLLQFRDNTGEEVKLAAAPKQETGEVKEEEAAKTQEQ